jgi:hypothetical protein
METTKQLAGPILIVTGDFGPWRFAMRAAETIDMHVAHAREIEKDGLTFRKFSYNRELGVTMYRAIVERRELPMVWPPHSLEEQLKGRVQ